MRTLLALVVAVLVALGLVWFLAGRASGPAITLAAPTKVVGYKTPLKVEVYAPGGTLTGLEVTLEQNGQAQALGSLAQPQNLTVTPASDRVVVTGDIGRKSAPALKTGTATLVIQATRPVLFGLRQVSSTIRKDLQVRLTPPTLAVQSQFHFINQGGAEVVVYTVSPADADSGVRVGDREYPGLPAAGAGIPADELPHVVKRFYRGGYARDQAVPGVGLGLSIADRIMRAHGGSLTVESAGPGRGTRARMTVPQ